MPKSTNDERKDLLESADYHLYTAIDRFFALWSDIFDQHPELATHLTDLMCDIERSRFRIQQFYHLCWGGRPGWMLSMSEITHKLRKQRADWAREIMECSESANLEKAGKVKDARTVP
jgi:hypothetical protein